MIDLFVFVALKPHLVKAAEREGLRHTRLRARLQLDLGLKPFDPRARCRHLRLQRREGLFLPSFTFSPLVRRRLKRLLGKQLRLEKDHQRDALAVERFYLVPHLRAVAHMPAAFLCEVPAVR